MTHTTQETKIPCDGSGDLTCYSLACKLEDQLRPMGIPTWSSSPVVCVVRDEARSSSRPHFPIVHWVQVGWRDVLGYWFR